MGLKKLYRIGQNIRKIKTSYNSLQNPDMSDKQISPISHDKNGNIMLHILAKPGAKANSITGIEDEGIGVKINARAVEGEANSELISYLTQLFGLKKSEISLDKGMKSRQKTVLITKKDITHDEIVKKLKEEIK